MSGRRLDHPRRADDPAPVEVVFDGMTLRGRPGEPWAYTLLAHGIYVLGRSAKYHRPRGMFCGTGSCGQCVARINGLPNRLLCQTQAVSGDGASAQNTWGWARFDMLSIIDTVFWHGLNHHRLMTHTGPLNAVAVGTARYLAGLGRLPTAPSLGAAGRVPDARHAAVAVVGGGAAGQAVATATRAAGLDTIVLDMGPARHANDVGNCRVLGLYDDQVLVGVTPTGQVRVNANAIVLAPGANEQPAPCEGNDRPGVFALRAAEQAMRLGILPGRRVAVAVAPDADGATRRRAWALVESLKQAGVEVPVVTGLPAFGRPHGRLEKITGMAPNLHLQFSDDVQGAHVNALVWCGRPAPAYELPRQMGLETPFVPSFAPSTGGFVPLHEADGSTAREGLFLAGEVCGVDADGAAAHGAMVGATVARLQRRGDAQVGVSA